MSKHDNLVSQILGGQSDANISFDALRQLLIHLGFEERIRSSHHIFRKSGIEEKINLQREGNKTKVYQIRQVRNILLKYKIGGEE